MVPLLVFWLALTVTEPKSRYLVETTGAGVTIELPFASRDRALRNFVKFRTVNGYAVDLTPSEVETLRRAPHVRSIEPDARRYPTGRTPTLQSIPYRPQVIPYGVHSVNAPSVWPVTRGEGIRVAVIDTGIDAAHEDLAANYKGGYDFVHEDSEPNEEAQRSAFMHGTLMAGVLAAADNGVGLVGVAPRVDLYALKIVGVEFAQSSDVIEALEWSIANRMQVLSCSYGGPTKVGLEEAVYRRVKEAGIVIVSSAGNESHQGLIFPGAYDSVLSIGATDEQRRIANFSNWGPELDFVAPGVDVPSTAITGAELHGGVLLADGRALIGTRLAGTTGNEVTATLFDAGDGAAGNFTAAATGAIVIMTSSTSLSTINEAGMANARAAGAAGAIFVNDRPGACTMSLLRNLTNPPAVCVSQFDGAILRTRTGQTATMGTYTDHYFDADGTSMSVPHVAGAAALLLALGTGHDVVQALVDTALDLGPQGWDEHFGHGLIDVGAAARKIAPERFVSSGETRRRSARH